MIHIAPWEKEILRELAKKQLEYSALPVMAERTRLWYAHNALQGVRPLIVVEMGSFSGDMLPPLRCETPLAQQAERQMLMLITNHEMIDDDKVMPGYFQLNWDIRQQEFGIDISVQHSTDNQGRNIGFSVEHPIRSIREDFGVLKSSVYSCDKALTMEKKETLENVFGDILPIRIMNNSLEWHLMPSARSVKLMGMEELYMEMLEDPEQVHRLMRYHVDDLLAQLRWQEENGLLTMNNANNYVGSGSFGFTDELHPPATGPILTKHLWGNMNSQESVGISPALYREMVYPYYAELAAQFGLVYYGCCEAVHEFWKDGLENLPHLRKISVSPWCNEDFMGEALRGSKVIYSRKPAPKFLGIGKKFDEEGFRSHIRHTLDASKGCELEIIFRDVYTMNGDTSKPGRAVRIIREMLENR